MKLKNSLSLCLAGLLIAACESCCIDDQGASSNATGNIAASGGATQQPAQAARTFADFDRVFFAFDKSDLTSESAATLAEQVKFLTEQKTDCVHVSGYCDPRGTVAYNNSLGNRRATAAADHLRTAGFAGHIKTISYGKNVLLDSRNTEEGYAKCRAAVTTIGDEKSAATPAAGKKAKKHKKDKK